MQSVPDFNIMYESSVGIPSTFACATKQGKNVKEMEAVLRAQHPTA